MKNDNKNPIRVLHVEDEKGALEITKLFLERKGQNDFEVTQALSAEQGLEKLENGNFDVVISDYRMPGMDGLEFLEELRKRGNDIPFIIFTGKGEERVAIEALNRGANRYIKKEGSPNVLFDNIVRHIRELVRGRRTGQEAKEEVKTEHGSGETYDALVRALNAPDWSVRMDAAKSLGELGDVRAVEPLIKCLEDEDEDVRSIAAEALGKIGDAKAIEPLIKALNDNKKVVRSSAAEALGRIVKPEVEQLMQALKDKSARVRLEAAEALGRLVREWRKKSEAQSEPDKGDKGPTRKRLS